MKSKLRWMLLIVVMLALAIPAATQDDEQDNFNKTYRTDTLINCKWWNINSEQENLGYIVGFNDGSEVASVVADNGATYRRIMPMTLQFGEIQNRVNSECSKNANAKVAVPYLIRKIHNDMGGAQ